MKKLIFTLLCSVWGAVAAQNIDSMTLSYKGNLGESESQLLEFQHLHNMNVDFSESVNPRKLEFRQIVCRDGVLNESEEKLRLLYCEIQVNHIIIDVNA